MGLATYRQSVASSSEAAALNRELIGRAAILSRQEGLRHQLSATARMGDSSGGQSRPMRDSAKSSWGVNPLSEPGALQYPDTCLRQIQPDEIACQQTEKK